MCLNLGLRVWGVSFEPYWDWESPKPPYRWAFRGLDLEGLAFGFGDAFRFGALLRWGLQDCINQGATALSVEF